MQRYPEALYNKTKHKNAKIFYIIAHKLLLKRKIHPHI